MSATVQLREGGIAWHQDLTGSTASRLFSALNATTGQAKDTAGGMSGTRIHVAVNMTAVANTSCTVGLYGYANNGDLAGKWFFLGAMNNGTSITPDSSANSPASNEVALAEVFTVSGENYSRYATCATIGGTTPVISTYIGYVRG